MKSTFYSRLAVLAVAGFLLACSAASPDDDKKVRLDKLKAEQANLSKELAKLEEEIAKENPDSTAVRAKEIAVIALTPQKFDHYAQTQGQIDSENSAFVSAQTQGIITQLYVTEGDQVSKGQVLAQIDNAVIMRSIESMKAQLELANSVFERQKNLWNQKIGTEVQFLQTKTNKETLEKQLASLQEQNEMTRIKAPVSGTVDAVSAKVGENTMPGLPSFLVVNFNDLRVVASVSEAFITQIKKGNRVMVNIPELGRDLEARVSFAGKTINTLSRTFPVEVKLPSNADLRPNMSATIKVVFQSDEAAIVVPVNVIQSIKEEKIVYVAEAKGKQTVARRKVIKVEGVFGGQASVKGLNAGDQLITVGYQGLNDGDYVKI